MPRRPRTSYATSVVPLIARDPDTLSNAELLDHLDALRAECARIFAIRQGKAERVEPVLREADAVAALSDRFCELYAYAERRMGIGMSQPHRDLMNPSERALALADAPRQETRP